MWSYSNIAELKKIALTNVKSDCGSAVGWIDLYVPNGRSLCVLWKLRLWKRDQACLATQAFISFFLPLKNMPLIANGKLLLQSKCLWLETVSPANHLYVSCWHSCVGCKVWSQDLQNFENRKNLNKMHKGTTLSVPSCEVLGGGTHRNNKLFDIVRANLQRGTSSV